MQDLQVWCDVHLSQGERVPATTIRVSVNDYTRIIDLCDECRHSYIVPLTRALDDHGALPSRPAIIKRPYSKGESGSYACTHPGCIKHYRHKSTLRTHVQQVHNMTLAELHKRYGDGNARQNDKPQAGEYECPECGALYTRAQGLGMHRSKVHGVRRHP